MMAESCFEETVAMKTALMPPMHPSVYTARCDKWGALSCMPASYFLTAGPGGGLTVRPEQDFGLWERGEDRAGVSHSMAVSLAAPVPTG